MIRHSQAAQQAGETISILQGVRALAALAVLIYHAGHSANKNGGPMPGFEWIEWGRSGVDIFFVLSGFIIPYVTLSPNLARNLDCRNYLWTRVRRIFVPYLPVGIAMAVLIYGLLPDTLGQLRGWFVSLTLLPVGRAALNVAWTLQHEIVFYAFVAAGIYLNFWRIGLVLWLVAIAGFWFAGMHAPIGL